MHGSRVIDKNLCNSDHCLKLIGGVFVPLFLLSVVMPQQVTCTTLNCHKICICASNIVSCSMMNLSSIPAPFPRYISMLDLSFNAITKLPSEWSPVKLSKLYILLLSHNGLKFLSSMAFEHVTQLRTLDLSSNALVILEESIFEPLEKLEVLLLYNNRISQIDYSAFVGLFSLQKLYLSQNLISRFPLELLKDRSRFGKLILLDVSFNQIKALPLQELEALPAWIKNSLYFHNNSLPCSCELYSLLARWDSRQLSSASDFKDSHICILPGPKKIYARVFDLNREMNCSTVKLLDEEAFLNQRLILDCDTKQRNPLKTWTTPGNAAIINQSAVVLPDGRLHIGPLKPEDTGTYTCFAVGEAFNETIFISVKVHNFTQSGGGEGMSTAYTTLVGCLASVVLVLVYLYLTPCRCPCSKGHDQTDGGQVDSIHSSTLSVSPIHEEEGQTGGGSSGKASLSRHVAFLDPKELLEQNGRVNPDGEEEEEEERQGCREQMMRRKSDADSVSSVSSDTPIVV
ncbi:amphoterin-induced protein 1-like [Chanos chanos]|uniref:Amphoterin-induced protein 1-like n=1 Tax=Chanos chanos TaxID=29144 RepID=A0A6J2VQD2_CHACN|nr:amphoterin-induced protein 1-like [Chanos chanos]